MRAQNIWTGLLVALTIASLNPAYASKGDKEGNGGDMCEDRIKVVRDDIASWINKGGSAGLQLPRGIDNAQYSSLMLNAISQAKVSCTDAVIKVGQSEKTCKNFIDGGAPRIVCNAKRFLDTNESQQYVLIHHEYAGLAQIEQNYGDDSNYSVSNQISGYLVNEVVKRLAVRPRSVNNPGNSPDFDALQKLQEGEQRYLKSLEVLAKSKQDNVEMEAELRADISRLASMPSQSEALRQDYQACSKHLEVVSARSFLALQNSVPNEQERLNQSFQSLKSLVAKYVNAQNCTDCDSDIREQTLKKYRSGITSILVRDLDAQVLKKDGYVSFITGLTECSFDNLFAYDDEPGFKQAQQYTYHTALGDGMTGADLVDGKLDCNASIPASDLLRGTYADTLDHIAEKGPYPVKRTTSIFGKPFGKVIDGELEIRLTYSLRFGYQGAQAPQDCNPVYFVHQSQK
jgi:hypothetical protein